MELKKDTDFFIGKSLMQICFGLYQLQLNFNDNIRIEVSEGAVYEDIKKTQFLWNFSNGRLPFPINNLIEYTITKANFSEENSLTLFFNNNEKLKIISAGDNKESYIVNKGNDFEVIY